MKTSFKYFFNLKFIFIILLMSVVVLIIKIEYSVKNTKHFTLIAAGFSPTHLNYPLQTKNQSKAFYKVAQKWSINFESYGCSLTSDTLNFMRKTNFINDIKLKRKYGFDWKKKFLKEVEEEILQMK